MKTLLTQPLEQVVAKTWNGIDPAHKTAFLMVLLVNLLAFGFEMTNLTLHHDDLAQIFIQDTILGYYLGRFGVGWLHYYTQNAYFMPFLQMAEGMVLMTFYGLLIARFWGARKTLDMTLIAAIVCVFPFMAQIYQYNSCMATYPLAHLMAAAAVVLSVRATPVSVALAALLYVGAFSIYQSVLAVAATVFLLWALTRQLFPEAEAGSQARTLLRSTLAAIIAVVAGGLLYMAAVSTMDIPFDAYQGAGEAFQLKEALDPLQAARAVFQGSRSFYLWPENYFPGYLKEAQLLLFALAAALCLWLPKGLHRKALALAILALAMLAPRTLQLLHAKGNFHNLTLTGYAVVVAGFVMIVQRAGKVPVRNLSTLLAVFLIAGYVLQCNWISTVNLLNTQAHYATLTQVLTRIKSLPADQWDGRRVVVVGQLDMPSDYPFKSATGVATEFMDAPHMQELALLMRERITFLPADDATPEALAYAASHTPWPSGPSVGTAGGMAVVVLSPGAAKAGQD